MNSKPSTRGIALGLAGLALILSLGLASASVADETPTPVPAPTGSREESVRVSLPIAGMIVSIDPKTGRLRPPTPEEAQQLAAAMARSLAQRKHETRIIEHRDGMLSAVVGIDYAEYANFEIVTLGPDGQPEHRCAEGRQAADAVLISHQLAQPATEEE